MVDSVADTGHVSEWQLLWAGADPSGLFSWLAPCGKGNDGRSLLIDKHQPMASNRSACGPARLGFGFGA